ncbi:MAG: KAP family P-loop NTPase fold protein [Aeromonas popoffii]|uniref:KAP family P-loop NTPase fold protein n=1 Tax=Aeromonas popoffii TaxID=70856 RepID=UPI003F2EFDD7
MSKSPLTSAVNLDRSVVSADEDRYGFVYVAQQLAQAIGRIGREGSAVIGIEGAWGTGKTSLLNLLYSALEERREERTHLLTISPWLDGGNGSPVESLLIPVAAIIAEEETRIFTSQRCIFQRKKSLTATAKTVLQYTQLTARHLVPIAETAALIPGIPNASGALKAFSEADLRRKRKTTAELRTEISERIEALDLSFIVLLDDLDRLEPAQAIEVIRMVKSVADFPRFRYLLCYDKAVLAQAIKVGLGIHDGELYLQKIVQISFSLPRPESFDLRREFLSGAVRLFESVNEGPAGDDLLNDLNLVTDIYGASLKTPREVQLALNGMLFLYEGIRDYVYLPDLCFLQLIRITNNGLYDWIEEYLTELSVVVSGDGRVSKEEEELLVQKLNGHLSHFQSTKAKSAVSLRDFIPSINGYYTDNLKLFCQVSDETKAEMTATRRLSSDAYWRYYFAFSSPQNILPPNYFDKLFHMAAINQSNSVLADELLRRIDSNGVSSRTWFEHILSQMTWPMISRHSATECVGLLTFFFNYGDEIISRFRLRNSWFFRYDLDVSSVVNRLLKKMLEDDRAVAIDTLITLATTGRSWAWIANYIRDLLWQNGMTGNRPEPLLNRVLTNEELEIVRQRFSNRLNDEIKSIFPQENDLGSLVFAWQDIAGSESAFSWITQHSNSDEGFLKLLLGLRSHIISSTRGHYLVLKVDNICHLFGGEEQLLDRLASIEAKGHFNELTKEIRASIKLNSSF